VSQDDTPSLRVALGEYDIGWHDPAASLARAEQLVQRARKAGARLVVLPEMCTTGFTMDAERWAEPFGGEDAERLRSIARVNGVWLVAGIAGRAPDGAAHNVAIVLSPSGELAGAYRKQRLFAYGGEHEAYVGGDGPIVVTMDGVRVSPFVCYDLRFPELFRAVARRADVLVVIANWPAVRRAHWDLLLRARAVENLAYVVGVNRTGEGGGLSYDGGSAGWGPWGDALAPVSREPTIVTVDPGEVAAVRKKYPFLEDMQLLL
jgi:omega-amidase